MTRPAFLMLGHGYSAAALAARLPGWRRAGHDALAGGRRRSAAGVEALRLGGRGGGRGGDRRRRRRSSSRSRRPTAATRRSARYGAALAAVDGRGGSAISRRRRSMATGRADGWTRTGALAPVSERGRWRVAAEAAWLASGLPVQVFRLAGIYGPGRSAFDKLREGRAHRVVKPGQVFSRIHVDDIARVLAASMARPDPGRAYNVADDEPAPPQDVIAYRGGAPRACRCRRRCRSRRRSSRRWRGASTASRSGWRTGGSRRSSGCGSPGPTIAPGSAAILAAGC